MDLEKCIDVIIKQEQKEIKTYNTFAVLIICAFSILFIFNLISGYIKEIAPAGTNFLTLVVGYLPYQQITKRKKRIQYLDKIIRLQISEEGQNKDTFSGIIVDAIKEAFKS